MLPTIMAYPGGSMSAANKIDYFEKIETHSHQNFVQSHGNCALCRSPLQLKHIRNDSDAQIKEEAYCPECDVKIRARIHTLN